MLVGEEEGVVLADADAAGAGGAVGEEDELLQQLHPKSRKISIPLSRKEVTTFNP